MRDAMLRKERSKSACSRATRHHHPNQQCICTRTAKHDARAACTTPLHARANARADAPPSPSMSAAKMARLFLSVDPMASALLTTSFNVIDTALWAGMPAGTGSLAGATKQPTRPGAVQFGACRALYATARFRLMMGTATQPGRYGLLQSGGPNVLTLPGPRSGLAG